MKNVITYCEINTTVSKKNNNRGKQQQQQIIRGLFRTQSKIKDQRKYASETFYQFLDLRSSILKQFLQIIIIVEKT